LFKVISTFLPVRVSVGNRPLSVVKSADDLNRQAEGFYYSVADRQILIKTPDREDFEVKVQY